jgi:hypothetical protein
MRTARILVGDVRDRLQSLPAQSVQCCVTSPPYWGLRDYGTAGQLGLEPTPDLYVQAMVAVFREVRRVLRDDGTLFLNLGDTYASTGGEREYGSSDGGTGRGPGTRRYRPDEPMTLREDLTPAEVAYVLRELAACSNL